MEWELTDEEYAEYGASIHDEYDKGLAQAQAKKLVELSPSAGEEAGGALRRQMY